MTLRDRLIGGAVDGLMLAIDTITPFWQTPREVEWAKAAADGLAEREAEEEVWSPPGGNMQTVVLSTVTEPCFGQCTCPCINCSNQAHWMCHGEGVEIDTQQRPDDDDDDTPRCYFCGEPTGNIVATEDGTDEYVCDECVDPETSAPTPGAESGPAEGEPPEPSAGVGTVCIMCFRPSGNCDCFERLFGTGPARSAAVESPASVPAAECSAPEFDWVTTAIPVIAGVLAEHGGRVSILGGVVRCFRAGENRAHAEFAEWLDWSNHVAPHIAIAIQSDLLSTIYEDTTFAINAFSGDRPRPLADFPKHQ